MAFDLEAEAKRRAEALVKGDDQSLAIKGVTDGGDEHLYAANYRRPMASPLDHVRRALARELIRFAEDALRACPVPGGMDEADLGRVRRLNAEPREWSHEDATGWIDELLAHVDHLHAVMRVPESQEYAAGYDAAAREYKEALAVALRHLKLHDEEYDAVTPPTVIEQIEALLGEDQ